MTIADQLAAAEAKAAPTIKPQLSGSPTVPAQQMQTGFKPRTVQIIEGLDLTTHLNMAIYGAEGSAKTVFAATAPKPLFLDTENSTTSLADWPDLLQQCRIARRVRWEHADTILERLSSDKDPWADRETVILDTFDALQASNLQAILKGGKTDEFLPMEHHYKKSGEMLRRWITDLRDLDRFHLIVLVHEKEIFQEGTGARFVRPALTPKVMEVLWRDFDIVGHMRSLQADWEQPFSNGLQVRSDGVIKAKCRLRYMPAQIRDPHMDQILHVFNASREAQNVSG